MISSFLAGFRSDTVEYTDRRPTHRGSGIVMEEFNYKAPNPAKVHSFESALKFFNSINYRKLPQPTEENLINIVKHLVKDEFNVYYHLRAFELLEKGFRKSKEFTTAKILRVFSAHIEKMQREYKFDVNHEINIGNGRMLTPIGFAAESYSPALLQALINAGGNVNSAQKQKGVCSPLHLFFFSSPIHQFSPPIPMEWRGPPPIHTYSFPSEKNETLDVLLKNGCDPNLVCDTSLIKLEGEKKLTPLKIALRLDNQGAVKSLIKAKADIYFKTQEGDIDGKIHYGEWFVNRINWERYGQCNLLQWAVSRYIDVSRYNLDRNKISFETIKLLVEEGDPDVFATAERGHYVWEMASCEDLKSYLVKMKKTKFPSYVEKIQVVLLESLRVKPLTNIVVEYLWGHEDIEDRNVPTLPRKMIAVEDDEVEV